jgi:hypothetical protein
LKSFLKKIKSKVAIAPGDDSAFVANGAGAVTKIDPRTNQMKAIVKVDGEPNQLEVFGDEDVSFACFIVGPKGPLKCRRSNEIKGRNPWRTEAPHIIQNDREGLSFISQAREA